MDEQSVVAYHEAGHALLAERLGGRVMFLTIDPVDDDGPRRHGETQIAWNTSKMDEKQLFTRQLQVALAGPVAEMIYSDEHYAPEVIREWWADWLIAEACIRQLRPGLTPSQTLSFLQTVLQELIEFYSRDENWDRLAGLAVELEAHETLEQDQLDELREVGVL